MDVMGKEKRGQAAKAKPGLLSESQVSSPSVLGVNLECQANVLFFPSFDDRAQGCEQVRTCVCPRHVLVDSTQIRRSQMSARCLRGEVKDCGQRRVDPRLNTLYFCRFLLALTHSPIT